MSTDVPEPWASAMIRTGLVDPRNGRPSMSRLAAAVESHPSTISAMMSGSRRSRADLLERVAAALQMSDRVDEVYAWAGMARETNSPFVPHADAELLTADERKIINELIKVMVAGRRTRKPLTLSLDEALAKIDGPPVEVRLPSNRRPDLVTEHAEGLTVWEVKSYVSPKNRHTQELGGLGQVLMLAQEVEEHLGRPTRGIVVLSMDDAREGPGRNAWSAEHRLRAAAEAFGSNDPIATQYAPAARDRGVKGSVQKERDRQDAVTERPDPEGPEAGA